MMSSNTLLFTSLDIPFNTQANYY